MGALEIDSTHPVFHDILREQMQDMGVSDMLFIGNPPFGKRGDLALTFVNSFLDIGGVVAFVLPNLFRRWSVQQKVRSDASLLMDLDVARDAFHHLDGSPYEVNCCFQVWSTRQIDHKHRDWRLTQNPPAKHPDFTMRRWNRQGSMQKVFNWNWDFAVRCQGHGSNYRQFLPTGSQPSDKAHYIMFKASNPQALAKLQSIDFEALAQSQTITPGFGASDVVAAYSQI